MKKSSSKIKYYLEYIAFIVILKLLKLVGIEKSANICAKIARAIGPLLPITKNARRNIKKILGNDADSAEFITNLWDNFGRFIGEFPFINSMSEQEVEDRIKISGLEYIKEFKEANQPILMFTGHFANWDFCLRYVNKICSKFGVVYRKSNNPYVDGVIRNLRNCEGIRFIAKGSQGVKDLTRSIRAKESILMLVDQKMNDGIEVPFFGFPAMTPNAIAKLALKLQYPIIPCQIVRTHGSNFEIVLHKAISYNQTNDLVKDCYNIMLKINKLLEQWIIQHPSQWLWFHNRWGRK
ncbi:MAG: hypothetical protein ACRYE9_03255 [Janthinobacterium lividum]